MSGSCLDPSCCPPLCAPQEDGRFAHFELVYCKCVDTYVRVKQNQNQVCWKWVKVRWQMRSMQSMPSCAGSGAGYAGTT